MITIGPETGQTERRILRHVTKRMMEWLGSMPLC
jgi:hypothetical protein